MLAAILAADGWATADHEMKRPSPANRHPYAGAIVVIAPFYPRYLSAPSSTYNISPPAEFTEGTIEALAIAITPYPAPNWPVAPKPMYGAKHDFRICARRTLRPEQ